MNKEKELAYAEIGKHLWENREDPKVRKATAAKITQEVSNRLETTDVVPLFLDTQTLTFGDELEFFEKQSQMKAYTVESDGRTPRSYVFKRTYRPTPKDIHVHPAMNLKLLKSGRYGSMEDLINDGVRAIQTEQNDYLFNVLKASVVSGKVNYATCATPAALETAMKLGKRWIDDRSGVRAIVGRSSVLDLVNDFNQGHTVQNYSDMTLEEIMKRGVLSTYRGAPLVGLKRQEDSFGKNIIPADEIWVVGNNVGKFVYETEMDSLEGIDVDTWEWHINMYRRISALVIFPENLYRIKLT